MSIDTLRWFRRALELHCLMALLVFCTPLIAAKAATPTTTYPTASDHLTSQSIAAITIQPAQILSHPNMVLLPTEVAEAACQKYLGISANGIARVTVIAEPPLGMQPYYAVVVDFTEPMTLEGLNDELLDAIGKEMTSTSLNGRTLFESSNPMIPCIYMLSDEKLVIAPRGMLDKMLKLAAEGPTKGAKPSPLVRAMSGGAGDVNDFHMAIMLKPIQPLIQMGMMGAQQKVEPKYHKYLDMVGMLNGIVATFDVSGQRNSYLRIYANTPEDADKIDALIGEGINELRDQVLSDPTNQYLEISSSEDPVVQSGVQYMHRINEYQIKLYRPTRLGKKGFVIAYLPSGDTLKNPLIISGIIGLAASLLLPAIQAAREAAQRQQAINDMKQDALELQKQP